MQVAKLEEEEDVLEGQGHYASQGGHLPRMQCKSWCAPLAKPHGDHHHTCMMNECQIANAIIYLSTQVPVNPQPVKIMDFMYWQVV